METRSVGVAELADESMWERNVPKLKVVNQQSDRVF